MTHAAITLLIDLQNGFMRPDLTSKNGGSLYVPGGEQAAKPAADLVRRSSNHIFVLSQDFHPVEHISFMDSHKGVMALRREALASRFKAAALEAALLDPLILPFTEVVIRKGQTRYEPIACKVGNQWHKVDTNYFKQIVHIFDERLSPDQLDGAFVQKLWRRHCVQRTESALFAPQLMDVLPQTLQAQLRNDDRSAVLHAADARGNIFYVIRKGMKEDLDSYGIATENDRVSQTQAPVVFAEIAETLRARGVRSVDLDIGGLATNFCTELSEIDVYTHFVPVLATAGITSKVHLLTDLSFGIPISTADGSWPDLESTPIRMAARGTSLCTTTERSHFHLGDAVRRRMPKAPLFDRLRHQ